MDHRENRSDENRKSQTGGPETEKTGMVNRNEKSRTGINTIHPNPIDQKRKAEENRGDRAFGGNEERDITV